MISINTVFRLESKRYIKTLAKLFVIWVIFMIASGPQSSRGADNCFLIMGIDEFDPTSCQHFNIKCYYLNTNNNLHDYCGEFGDFDVIRDGSRYIGQRPKISVELIVEDTRGMDIILPGNVDVKKIGFVNNWTAESQKNGKYIITLLYSIEGDIEIHKVKSKPIVIGCIS